MTTKVRDILQRTWIPLAVVVVVAALTTVSGQLASRPSRADSAPDAGLQAAAGNPASQEQDGQERGRGRGRGGSPPAGYGEWWKDAAVKQEIGISDEVAARIDEIWQVRSEQVRTFDMELRVERQKANEMLRERSATEAEYLLQLSLVLALNAERDKIRNVMLYRIWLELTPDQYKTLVEIRDRRRGGRGGPPR